jgi:hypothetical protein
VIALRREERVFKQATNKKVKKAALDASELALQLAQDRRFRKRLLSAIRHGSEAGRRRRTEPGLTAALTRFVGDRAVQSELRSARKDLQRAYARLDKKRRSHRLRNVALGAGLASMVVPQVRSRVAALASAATNHRDLSNLGRAERTHSLEDLTKEQLYARAQDADIPGRSDMSKDELIAALRAKNLGSKN